MQTRQMFITCTDTCIEEILGAFPSSAGANVNHLSADGASPLYLAAEGGHLKVIKLLVKRGANIQQESNQLVI